MRRVARHFFTIICALSMLLCVAMLVMWVRSHTFQEEIERRTEYSDSQLTESRWLRFDSQHGKLYVGYGYQQIIKLLPPQATSPTHWEYSRRKLSPSSGVGTGDGPAWLERLGISRLTLSSKQLGRTGAGMIDYTWGLRFDYWLLLLLSLLLSGVFVHFWRRATLATLRLRAGLCPTCGYDLRAHQAGERCPECGAAIPRAV